MKIGILIDRVVVGGVCKIAIQQVVALRKKGIEAYLVVLKRDPNISKDWLILKNSEVIYLDDRLPNIFRSSFKFPVFHFFSLFHLSYAVFLPFVIRKKEFDYFIVHGTYTAFSAISFKYFNQIYFSIFIWDPIAYIVERVYKTNIPKIIGAALVRFAVFLDKLIISQSKFVLVGGSAHNKYLLKFTSKQKLKTIPPSTNFEANIDNIKKGDYIAMSTAWRKGKNVEYLLDLLNRLPNLKLLMMGKWLDPSFKKYFINLIKDAGYEKNINITDQVTDKKQNEYYSKALVLLQTNDDRGFGMPALEAAGCGTTFIIPEGQGVCELFEDGVHGFYTKERETDKIVEYLSKFIKNKSLAKEMGRKAYEKVVANYTWSIHADKLLKIVRDS